MWGTTEPVSGESAADVEECETSDSDVCGELPPRDDSVGLEETAMLVSSVSTEDGGGVSTTSAAVELHCTLVSSVNGVGGVTDFTGGGTKTVSSPRNTITSVDNDEGELPSDDGSPMDVSSVTGEVTATEDFATDVSSVCWESDLAVFGGVKPKSSVSQGVVKLVDDGDDRVRSSIF